MIGKYSVIQDIDHNSLCLGCGLCESICGKENVEMHVLEDGFIHPVVKSIRKEQEIIIKEICPGVNIINDAPFLQRERIWGKIEGLYSGFAVDPEVRMKGSSGGIISAVAIYLIERKIVNAVLQVGGDENDYRRNTLRVSKTREDVLKCASSRYAPSFMFGKIKEIFEAGDDTYCFIGKPCDISALKNFLNKFPQYRHKVTLTVAIICAGMPSFSATEKIVNDFGAEKPVRNLVYRGNGWPGDLVFYDKAGKKYTMSYNDSWGKVLGRNLHVRCKICPDGIGLQADIVAGDAWETKDGYPDFSEKEGKSIVISRSCVGNSILETMDAANQIRLERLTQQKLGMMQPYQDQRRRRVGARILGFVLRRFWFPRFRNLFIWNNLLHLNPKVALKEFSGAYRRLGKY